MSHSAPITVSSQKGRRPLQGGQLGNAGRAGKIFTVEHQELFLKRYRKYRNVDRAAKSIGFRGATIFRQLKASKRFAALYEIVRQELMEQLEAKMEGFAFGTEAPSHPAQLTAMFGVLKANKPEKWRENVKVGLSAEGALGDFLTGMGSALAAVAQKASLPEPESPSLPALEHSSNGSDHG